MIQVTSASYKRFRSKLKKFKLGLKESFTDFFPEQGRAPLETPCSSAK